MAYSIRRPLLALSLSHGLRSVSVKHSYSTSRIHEIQSKKKHIPDHLSPTNSNLLGISLSDHLPTGCLAPLTPTPSSPKATPALPQGHHLVYFPIQARPSELHEDGTDMDHWPGPPFMRRMWAGGEVKFRSGWEHDMQLDAKPVTCVESVEDVRVSGIEEGSDKIDPKAKAFVDVWRRYSALGRESTPAIEERRTLVFMPELSGNEGAPTTKASPRIIKAPHKPDYSFSVTPTRALLANFSALSYNAHSIHLDTALTLAEGHRGLLVHGPLSLTLIFAALRGKLVSEDPATRDAVRWIGYRNVAPLYVDEELRVSLREKPEGGEESKDGERKWDVWVEGNDGGLAVKGTATTGPL